MQYFILKRILYLITFNIHLFQKDKIFELSHFAEESKEGEQVDMVALILKYFKLKRGRGDNREEKDKLEEIGATCANCFMSDHHIIHCPTANICQICERHIKVFKKIIFYIFSIYTL